MTAPIFIESRNGLAGLGTVDAFVPGQSYRSIIGEGYVPVAQPNDALIPVAPAKQAATKTAAAAAAPTASGVTKYLPYLAAAAVVLFLFRRSM